MRNLIIIVVLTVLGSTLVSTVRPVMVDSQPLLAEKVEMPELNVELASVTVGIAEKPNIVASVANPYSARDNESTVWKFLISQGFRQEHGFKTSDVSGGLGIAQWIGGRRSALIAFGGCTESPQGVLVGGCLNIDTQLRFLMQELNGSESTAGNAIRSATTVEEATRAFQNKFERCGDCREGTRIGYSQNILARY